MLTQTFLTLMIAAGSTALQESGEAARNAVARWREAVGSSSESAPGPRYQPAERAVTNWRIETASGLEPAPMAALAALVEADRPVVTRCVRLNNYWCIKSARWEGELGTDEEGHVGFASAERGADAAAVLLRRYYLEFGRKSALDIVRRWAPAECNLPLAGSGAGALSVGPLAVRGIGGTVRARWLASRRKVRITAQAAKPGGNAGGPAPRVSAAIAPAARRLPTPEVAPSMGDGPRLTISSTLPYRVAPPRGARPRAAAPRPADIAPPPAVGGGLTISSTLPYRMTPPGGTASPAATGSLAPVACAPDERRLQNYAGRIVDGLGLGPSDDLDLFAPDGTPKANLGPVLLAMSAFELGHLRASGVLVDGAVERQAARARALAQQAGTAAPVP